MNDSMAYLSDPIELPCGATLPNRIVKAAMSEQLASKGQSPSRGLNRLYERWSLGGAGTLITGNVMVDSKHLESVANVKVSGSPELERFRAWAEAGKAGGSAIFMQLNHPGRQTPRYVNAAPLAPSALPPVNLFRRAGVFGHSRAMSESEIEETIRAFARAASFAKEAAFSGVQVHAAHGYLISQFLSPLTNLRRDGWGGTLEGRSRFLRETLRAIRAEVGGAYPLSIKLNSTDFQRGGFTEEESLAVIRMLNEEGVDFIEISGGNYESRAMLARAEREVFFLDYAAKARRETSLPLMVTGGFRSRAVMEESLASGALDLIGIGRPFAQNPELGRDLIEGRIERAEDPPPLPGLMRIGGASEAMMSVVQMAMIAKGRDPAAGMSVRTLAPNLMRKFTRRLLKKLKRPLRARA